MFNKIFRLDRTQNSMNFDSIVDFQLSFLLYYASIVHTGLLILSLCFFALPVSAYYFVTLVMFLICARFIDSRNFVLIHFLTYIEITLHIYLIYVFFGVFIGIELYYIILIPVGCYALLMSFSRNLKIFFMLMIGSVNMISYVCVELVDSLNAVTLPPVYRIFLTYNIFTAFGMVILQSYFFIDMISRKFSNLQERSSIFQHQANYDMLTDIFNRREMTRRIDAALKQYNADRAPLSVCIGDIDNFKSINDTYGHNAGDYVLKTMCAIMKANIRKSDPFGRWGGEEFVLMMHTDLDACYNRAECLRRIIESHKFDFEGKDIPVTITFGIATAGDDTPSVSSLIEKADRMLYKGKKNGRNQTVYT